VAYPQQPGQQGLLSPLLTSLIAQGQKSIMPAEAYDISHLAGGGAGAPAPQRPAPAPMPSPADVMAPGYGAPVSQAPMGLGGRQGFLNNLLPPGMGQPNPDDLAGLY
jgi:hypothetical protein